MPEENGWVLPRDSSVPRVTKAIPVFLVPRVIGVTPGLKARVVNVALMVPWDQPAPKVTRAIPAFKALQGKKAKRDLLDFVVSVALKAFRDCPVPRVTRVILESPATAAGTTIKRKESDVGRPGLKSQISKVRGVIPDPQDRRGTEATGGTRARKATRVIVEFRVKAAGMTTRRKGSTVREAPGFRLLF
jgi:hypothetical protein